MHTITCIKQHLGGTQAKRGLFLLTNKINKRPNSQSFNRKYEKADTDPATFVLIVKLKHGGAFMKIHRGPKSGGYWEETDSKPPSHYIKDWSPRKKIIFDGTIDKFGGRHTELGLEIDEKDIISLFNALIEKLAVDEKDIFTLFNTFIKKHKHKNKQLEENIKDLEQEITILKEAFKKIYYLISFYSYQAPNKNALIKAVQKIAAHYYYSTTPSKGKYPKLRWIKWKSIS